MHFFVTVELQGDAIKRRTDVSELVDQPIFSQNKFYLPFNEKYLEQEPKLIFRTFVLQSNKNVANDD